MLCRLVILDVEPGPPVPARARQVGAALWSGSWLTPDLPGFSRRRRRDACDGHRRIQRRATRIVESLRECAGLGVLARVGGNAWAEPCGVWRCRTVGHAGGAREATRSMRLEGFGPSVGKSSNKRMKLTSVLAPAPRDTEEGHSACSPFGEHRTLAAYPRCSTDTVATSTSSYSW